MAEVQDDEQWLYGDAKDEGSGNAEGQTNGHPEPVTEKQEQAVLNEDVSAVAEPTQTEEKSSEQETSAEKPNEEAKGVENDAEKDDSSSDDEPTVTIGKIVKQPDIIRPPLPTHRAAPTAGLKDEDFETAGKINGVPATDFNLAELEEKPWRKPGADLSDYFNYGFNEHTWIKYCEKQKYLRTHDSGVGLAGLGVTISRIGSNSIPVSIVNENSKYGGLKKIGGTTADGTVPPGEENQVNTIQVMTADRRHYSQKVLSNNSQTFDDTDLGGSQFGREFFSRPPPYFGGPPPPWPPIPNVPPPGWTDGIPPPPITTVSSSQSHHDSNYFNDPLRPSKEERDDRHRSRGRSSERTRERSPERSPDRSRERETRRKRSRSRSRSRHRRRSRSRSRSKTPSHRHKRKRSKRDRE